MTRLIRLYPAAWRARYEAELLDLLDERRQTFSDSLDLVRGALDARLHPQLVEPGLPDVDMPPASRLPGLAAFAGGLTWAAMAVVIVLETHPAWSDLTALFWTSLCFMTVSLVGSVPPARSRQIRRGLTTGGVLLGLVLLPWDLKAVPALALIGLIGAGLLTVAGLRAGLSAAVRIAVVASAWVGPFAIAGLGSMGLLDLGPGTVWVQGVVAAPYGIAWLILGALMVRRGATSNERSSSTEHTEALAT